MHFPVQRCSGGEAGTLNKQSELHHNSAQQMRPRPQLIFSYRTMVTFVFDHGKYNSRPRASRGRSTPSLAVMYGCSVLLAFTYVSRGKYCRFLLRTVNQVYTRTDTILQSVDTVKYETYVEKDKHRAPSLEGGSHFR